MADFSYSVTNQTLDLLDKAIEENSERKGHVSYRLGMGVLGEECPRKIFYKFRGVSVEKLKAKTIRIFEDGHNQESIMAGYLKSLDGITLYDRDPNDPTKQIACESCLGHLKGYLDGMIFGIVEAPNTWHVWEHKCVNEKKFAELNKLKEKVGEKQAFKEWDSVYYTQGMMYCLKQNVTRHYLTVTTPGGRDWTSCRTNANNSFALMQEEKAGNLIFNNSIPEKISSKPEAYACKFCNYQGVCHFGDIPKASCKTCIYRQPVKDGNFFCQKKQIELDKMQMEYPCEQHLYLPALIPNVTSSVIVISTAIKSDYIIYELENGTVFANISAVITSFPNKMIYKNKEISLIFSSDELFEEIKNISNLIPDKVEVLTKKIKGTVMQPEEIKEWSLLGEPADIIDIPKKWNKGELSL